MRDQPTRGKEDPVESLQIIWESKNDTAVLGLLQSVDVVVRPTPDMLKEQIRGLAMTPPQNASVRDPAIRAMLRRGGFKPSGRNRPAQEYLSNVGRTPAGLSSICNIVDVNNYISLKHRLPASIIDASCAGDGLVAREGCPGETYIFNSSGQELRLGGLLCLSTRAGIALASPVKDAFAAHITEGTKSVIGCVYGSLDLLSRANIAELLEEFASLLSEHAGAKTTDKIVISAEGILTLPDV